MGEGLKCRMCPSRADARSGLVGHYLKRHKAQLGSFRCDSCPFKSRTRESWLRHRGARHRGKGSLYRCPECFYRGRDPWAFRAHVRVEHGGDRETLPCWEEGCGFGGWTRLQLARHLASGTHGGPTAPEDTAPTTPPRLRREGVRLVCIECGDSSRWRSAAVRHVNLRHPRPKIRLDPLTNKFSCSECKYSSKRKASIEAHITLRHKPPVEKFKCSQCPYTTKVKARLVKHEEKHTKAAAGGTPSKKGKRSSHKYKQFARDTEGLFRCTECDYSTKWRSSIIAHVDNYHNPDAEEYKCGQCSYKTRVKAYLQQHRVTHRIASTTGKKLKRTPRKYKQIVRDSELNVYRCSECEYSTKWRSSIIAHVDNYHNPDAEVYSCPKCAYTCKVKSYFVQHSRTHDAKPIKCEACSFVTKNKRLLEQHQKKCHPAWEGLVYLPIKLEPVDPLDQSQPSSQHGSLPPPPTPGGPSPTAPLQTVQVKVEPGLGSYMEEGSSLMSDWSEESVPDVNSLEPSIEPSPDLSLAIEMNLNDHDLFQQPHLQQEVGCPYCAYVTYSAEEMYQHMAIHQHPIHYYYTDQPVSL